eukprot:Skav215030  [mRNA]  locus=scaffold966:576283:578399:- [translate_table: standard]
MVGKATQSTAAESPCRPGAMSSDDDFPTPGWEERFPEPLKFLPVAFILAMIFGLYAIYFLYHLQPRMEDGCRAPGMASWDQPSMGHVVYSPIVGLVTSHGFGNSGTGSQGIGPKPFVRVL